MPGIPLALDTDVEDVVWALQTSASLWKRDERVDAIVWLRRAAQSAGEAEQDDRAFALAREAAELSEWIARNPVAMPSGQFAAVSIPPNEPSTGGVDDLLRASMPDIPIEEAAQVSMSAMTEPHAFMPVKPPQAHPGPVPITPAPPPIPESTAEVFQSLAQEPSSDVPHAAEAHAGLLDPWSTTAEEAPPAQVVSPVSSVVSSDEYDDEVVTSARLELPPAEPALVMVVPQKKPPTIPHHEEVAQSLESAALESVAPSAPPHEPPDAAAFSDEPTIVGQPSEALRAAAMPEPVIREAPHAPLHFPTEQTLVSAGVVPPDKRAKDVDLADVEAFADLPDEARAELENGAEVHRLACDEEVMGFALAYVVEGEIDVAAQIVDAAAERIGKGAVLKAKGSVAESVPLRLICASASAIVATWDSAQIEPAFKTCPWVEDDLRASANRTQALVGMTLGPLAERLDAALRAQITNKLDLREHAEGDVIIEAGQAVRDLCLVGQGIVELVKDGMVIGEVAVGDFLFAAEIMGGGKATVTARVGKGGALLLASDRSVAQELMVTCPPLLEIFSGM